MIEDRKATREKGSKGTTGVASPASLAALLPCCLAAPFHKLE
jgi:hypothetical protein